MIIPQRHRTSCLRSNALKIFFAENACGMKIMQTAGVLIFTLLLLPPISER